VAIVQSIFTEHLTQTLHTMVLSRQTGLMSIEHNGGQRKERGEVYFAAGQVVLARTGSEVGVAALTRIQGWHTAHYTFFEDATIPLNSIGVAHVPSLSPPGRSTRPLPRIQATPLPPSPPALKDAPEPPTPGRFAIFRARPSTATPTTMKRLERRERIVFALLDGRRTLHDVALLTHQGEVAVAHTLVQLFQQGYIEYMRG
jgi:hypothetical protein